MKGILVPGSRARVLRQQEDYQERCLGSRTPEVRASSLSPKFSTTSSANFSTRPLDGDYYMYPSQTIEAKSFQSVSRQAEKEKYLQLALGPRSRFYPRAEAEGTHPAPVRSRSHEHGGPQGDFFEHHQIALRHGYGAYRRKGSGRKTEEDLSGDPPVSCPERDRGGAAHQRDRFERKLAYFSCTA
jgi:hypothetical protein